MKRLLLLVLCLLGQRAAFSQIYLLDSNLHKPKPKVNNALVGTTNLTSYNTHINQIVPPSPTAAALVAGAESTVSYYTGSTSTPIELYKVTDQDLTTNVALQFNQGGVRVEEEASFVGLGVSLQASGAVTRTIRGSDDLNETFGWAFNVFPQNFQLGAGNNQDEVIAYYNKNRQYQYPLDTEPDIFYYNVNGEQGKFVLQANANNSFPLIGVPLDKSNVKIVCNKLAPYTYQWTITSEKGTVYTFEAQEVSASASSNANEAQYHENTGNYFGFNYNTSNIKQISAWFLTAITSPTSKATIRFLYKTDKLYTSTSRILFSELYKKIDDAACSPSTPNCNSTCGAKVASAGDSKNSLITAMSNQYLQSIIFQNGQVDFITEDRQDIQALPTYNSNNPFDDIFTQNFNEVITQGTITIPTDGKPQRLKEIHVKDKNGSLIKKWVLNAGYYNESLVNMNPTTKTDKMFKYNNLRLRLNSIQEVSSTGDTLPATKFFYEGDSYDSGGNLVYATLPSKVSTQKDLFGYYNGKTSNNIGNRLIAGGFYPVLYFNPADVNAPIFNGFFKIDGINREVDDTYKKLGTLNKIVFPTGGSRTFSYASHEAIGGAGDVDSTTYTSSFLLTNVSNTYYQLTVQGTCAGPYNGSPICGIPSNTVIATFSNGSTNLNITYADLQNSASCYFPTTGIQSCTYKYQPALAIATPGNYSLQVLNNRFTAKIQVFKYHPQNDKVVKLGGLRVESITINDNNGHILTKKYDYLNTDNTTSGIQLTPLVKYSYGYVEQFVVEGNQNVPSTCTGGQYGIILAAKSHIPLGSALGATHVGYNRVIETQMNGNDSNGSKVYEFKNDPLIGVNPYAYFNDAPLFPSYGNGMMNRQATYGKNGAIIEEDLFSPTMATTEVTAKGFLISMGTDFASPSMFVTPKYYDIRSEFWYNKQLTHRTYTGTNFVETITKQKYNNASSHYQLAQTMVSDSKASNRWIKTNYTYPYDYASTNAVMDSLIKKNRLSDIITKQETMVELDANDNVLRAVPIAWEKTNYASFSGRYLPSEINQQIGTGTIQTPIVFNNYDARGNISSYTLQNGQKASFTYFSTTDLGKTDLVKSYTLAGGTTGTTLARTINYEYIPLVGLSSTTDINGYTTTYNYDNFNRLASTKDAQGYLLAENFYHYANQTALTGLGISPTNASNYVVSRSAREAQTGTTLDSDVTKTSTQVQYLDGLGRPLQTQLWKATPDQTKDLITTTSLYDDFGRDYKHILPTPSSTNTAAYNNTAESLAQAFYSDNAPSTETVFEPSPLNRPFKQFGAGQAWRTANKFTQFDYWITGSEVVRFDIQANGSVTGTTYPSSSLYNNVVTSERGIWTMEVKDKQGRVVSKLQQLEANTFNFATTDYVYNDLGQLSYVIPPKIDSLFQAGTVSSFTESDNVFLEGIYGYHYDNKGRLIEKHIPGAGWTRYVYDKNDRVVLENDDKDAAANTNYYKFTQYDALGRAVRTGLMRGIGATNRTTIQTAFDNQSDIQYSSEGWGVFPSGYQPVDSSVKSVTYYDDYAWQIDTTTYGFKSAYAYHTRGLTKGLVTGALVRNLETNDWYKSVNYYDYKGRVIQSFSQNHLGGIDRTDFQYRFNNEVLKMRVVHNNSLQSITEIYEYTYDHVGRKTSFVHTKAGVSQKVAKYNYDAIGRMTQKVFKPAGSAIGSKQSGQWTDTNTWITNSLPTISDLVTINNNHSITIPSNATAAAGSLIMGTNANLILQSIGQLNMGNASTSNLQSLDYKYHIRGGLLGINLDANNDLTNSLFSFRLDYETGSDGFFDGNIRRQYWKSSLDGKQRAYEYSYDGASRIKSANYASQVAGENYALENMTYDRNGNILTLSRKGKTGTNSWGYIDQLSYAYESNSNKIKAVNDLQLVSNPNVGDFRDSSSLSTQYIYNPDGSLSSDDNKKITIEWNYLKVPKKITRANGQWKKFIYDANGKLLQTQTSTGITTDFIANLTYENGSLYQIGHDEGRINAQGQYEYDISDHAKNLRVSFRDSSGIAKVVTKLDYDPWGYRLKGLDYYASTYNKFKTFTGKQLHDDFGFNLLSYKFRFHDPALGRFISIDPLSEQYSYNSTFAFAENKLGLGIELEGLELVPYNLGNTVWKEAGFSHVPNQKENEVMVKKAAITTAKITAEVIGTAILGEILGIIAAPLLEGTIVGEMIGAGAEAKNLSSGISSTEKTVVSETKVTIDSKRLDHIFRNSEGHFVENTPKARSVIENTASNSGNTLGTDKYGNVWNSQIQKDGTQIWTQSRNGKVINAGVNKEPREFNEQTGLSSPVKQQQKK